MNKVGLSGTILKSGIELTGGSGTHTLFILQVGTGPEEAQFFRMKCPTGVMPYREIVDRAGKALWVHGELRQDGYRAPYEDRPCIHVLINSAEWGTIKEEGN